MNFDVVEIDGAEWLVHRELLASLPAPPATAPAIVVGVAQQGLFWKDIRRVLFSGSEYRVLARLNRDGLQTKWTPVKLVDVLAGVVPDFAEVMDTLNRGVLATISGAVAAQESSSVGQRVRAAVVAYGEMLGERLGLDVTADRLDAEGLLAYAGPESVSVREWREVFAPVTDFVAREAGTTIDREIAADYRVAAVTKAGLLEPAAPTFELEIERPDSAERFIDCEVIAVYW